MIGVVVKIHSNFYYVKCSTLLLECKIREKLKKANQEVFVGDKVVVEEIEIESSQGAIFEVLERTSFLPKPSIANIDQVITVSSIIDPVLDYSQLDRYLVNAGRHGFNSIICINKTDLLDNIDEINEIKAIYEPLGYKLIFLSAKTAEGIEEFKITLKDKISVLCGESGVGKSSIVNTISPGLHLKTKEISNKSHRGTHTTRHVELIELLFDDEHKGIIADAPGFSFLRFDDVLPEMIDEFFTEIHDFSKECFYNDCLHINEEGCNVIKNLNKIPSSRYNSYKAFIEEALEYKKKLINSGHKEEKKSKTIDKGNNEKVNIVKLGLQKREDSRKKNKQKLKNVISSLDYTYYNDECLD